MDKRIIIFCFLLQWIYEVRGKPKIRKFPKDFVFGVSSSAYQIEGAWNQDGKGLSIWDVATHNSTSPIVDQSNGDISTDSYNQYHRDIKLLKDLGVHSYKFSISWPRILPTGFSYKINEAGIDFYSSFLDKLAKNNIEPFVTMYHWDLPDSLQQLGGWANPHIVDWFADYAKVLFDKFASRVRYWITISDPHSICSGYGQAKLAPFVKSNGIGEYLCVKNIILAHTKVYKLYDENYKKFYNGYIGMSLLATWFKPSSLSPDDKSAAYDSMMFEWGIFAHPFLMANGDYPVEVRRSIAFKSAEQGFARTRLPKFTTEEKSSIRGSLDFLGIDHFTTKLVYRDASLDGMYPVPSYMDDVGAVLTKDPTWVQSQSPWLQEVPWGFRKLLVKIKEIYNNPTVFITGNGWSTDGGLLDDDRIRYLRNYLNSLLDAINDGCKVKGYMYWSLMDDFEWTEGYQSKFGLYDVDFQSPERAMTPRKSAYVYKQIIFSRTLDINFEPNYEVKLPNEKKKESDDNDVF